MYEILAEEFGITVKYHEVASSTNDLAAQHGCGAGTVIVAERQSAGRGQRGNSWTSPAGENLTFSVVLEPEFLKANMQFYISKITALALAGAIASLGLRSSIKWPNDIYIGDKKTAGILIENDIMGRNMARSIIGIGLNVNQRRFDPSLPNPTSLAVEAGGIFDRGDILRRVIKNLSDRYGQLTDGETGRLDADYRRLLYRLDEEHSFVDVGEGKKFRGIIRSVMPTGELEVEHVGKNQAGSPAEAGPVKSYLFKEVEFLF